MHAALLGFTLLVLRALRDKCLAVNNRWVSSFVTAIIYCFNMDNTNWRYDYNEWQVLLLCSASCSSRKIWP